MMVSLRSDEALLLLPRPLTGPLLWRIKNVPPVLIRSRIFNLPIRQRSCPDL